MQLARTHEMQELDRKAIEEFNIPGLVLMENAGRGTVDVMLDELGSPAGKAALIFVGPGNNGGDGLVIARRIHQLGGRPRIVYLVDPNRLQGDVGANRGIVTELNLDSVVAADDEGFDRLADDLAVSRPWAVIDALFGTGLRRPLEGRFLAAVRLINRMREAGSPVVAVDIPSGLNGDTGEVLGEAVHADLTATYGLAKPGHFLHGGERVGRLKVIDIGIPPEVVEQAKLTGSTLFSETLNVFTSRRSSTHKGTFGHLLVLAGSAGKTGAAFLCGLGGLRSGAGLVTLAVPADLRTVFEANLFEAMTLLLPESRRFPSLKDLEIIRAHMTGKTAMVIGPGLGTEATTRALVRELYREVDVPMVVDADGLNILAMEPELIADPPAPRILTPHPGEMARLSGVSVAEIQRDRLTAAQNFTAPLNRITSHVTTVLKGAGTVVCDPGGTWSINTSGNPGMAAGGMGDVLAGLIGGFIAQRIKPELAVRAGVYVHGAAADRLAEERVFGYPASEVAEMVPRIITEHLRKQTPYTGEKIC
ncbi:MAG: bifunctional ADP-dependent NAD(P)H-hydrate dehydratase/NAD(P)H-hydrate epimerase [Desulfobulbaceae bacterium]